MSNLRAGNRKVLRAAVWAVLGWGTPAVYALVASATRRPDRGRDPQPGSAARILDERLARDEIDTEEYQRLRDLIGSGRSDSPASAGDRR